MHKSFLVTSVLATSLVSPLACKSNEKSNAGDEAPAAGATKKQDQAHSEEQVEKAPVTTKAKPVAPPAEDQGHIAIAGERSELRGADFLICETRNPGIKGDFNIVGKLSDGTKFRLSGNVNEDNSAEHRGLFLGSLPDETRASELQVQLEGRTLSGTASSDKGAIEFSFEC